MLNYIELGVRLPTVKSHKQLREINESLTEEFSPSVYFLGGFGKGRYGYSINGQIEIFDTRPPKAPEEIVETAWETYKEHYIPFDFDDIFILPSNFEQIIKRLNNSLNLTLPHINKTELSLIKNVVNKLGMPPSSFRVYKNVGFWLALNPGEYDTLNTMKLSELNFLIKELGGTCVKKNHGKFTRKGVRVSDESVAIAVLKAEIKGILKDSNILEKIKEQNIISLMELK